MNYFSFNQIVEIRIREFYNRNKKFGVEILPALPKDNQSVSVPITEVKGQLSLRKFKNV